MKNDPKLLLLRMKQVLKNRGWVKGHLYMSVTGECCLTGAYAIAQSGQNGGLNESKVQKAASKMDHDNPELVAALVSSIKEVNPLYEPHMAGSGTIVSFNDNSTTSLEDIYAVVDRALTKV